MVSTQSFLQEPRPSKDVRRKAFIIIRFIKFCFRELESKFHAGCINPGYGELTAVEADAAYFGVHAAVIGDRDQVVPAEVHAQGRVLYEAGEVISYHDAFHPQVAAIFQVPVGRGGEVLVRVVGGNDGDVGVRVFGAPCVQDLVPAVVPLFRAVEGGFLEGVEELYSADTLEEDAGVEAVVFQVGVNP